MKPPARDALSGLSSMATRFLLADLARAYARAPGHAMQIEIESVGGLDAVRRVQAGEPFDLVFLSADTIERLESTGHIVPGSRVDVACSAVAIAVRAGTPRPAVQGEEELRHAVLAARAVGYSTGPSGAHLARLFERWGVADRLAPRLVQAPPAVPVGERVARGEVELGFQQLSELLHVRGIDVLGTLPAGIECVTVFSGGVGSACTRPDGARAFLAFAASPEAGAAKRSHGMDAPRGP